MKPFSVTLWALMLAALILSAIFYLIITSIYVKLFLNGDNRTVSRVPLLDVFRSQMTQSKGKKGINSTCN